MTSKAFIVDDFVELLALQRVFREAKFCIEPDDTEVSGSPIVAKLFERLMMTLIDQQTVRDGEQARQRWLKWLTIDESRDEWFAAIRRASADVRWAKFTDDERANYVKILLSPFILSPAVFERFVVAVNQATNKANGSD